MKKADLIRIITKCAKQYKEELLDKSLLIIFGDSQGHTSALEVCFSKTNFLHLTGVRTQMRPGQFFKTCLNSRLKDTDVEVRKDGTTEQKLAVLPFLMTKNLSAKMIGDYLPQGINLITEKMVGNVRGCLGFVPDKATGQYVPNTILQDDIRKRVVNQQKIMAIYRKDILDERYEEAVFTASGVTIESVLTEDIKDKISK